MKFHEIDTKFKMIYSNGAIEILKVVEHDGSNARCTKCRFRKAERNTFTGAIHSWGCRLDYNNTMCGVPNNRWSNGNERPDGKSVIYV